jgi:hypothetical protein
LPPPDQLLRAFPILVKCRCTSTTTHIPRRAPSSAPLAAGKLHRRSRRESHLGIEW